MQGQNRRSLVLCVTTLVLVTLSVCWSDGQPVTCTMPSVEKGQVAELTCDFGVDMQNQSNPGDIIIQHRLPSDGGALGEVLDCYWEDGEYKCKVMNPRFVFKNEISRSVSVYLPSVSENDVGKYFCDVKNREMQPCNFTLREASVTMLSPTTPSATKCPDCKDKEALGTGPWKTLFVVFLVLLLVLIFIIAIVIVLLMFYPGMILPKLRAFSRVQTSGQQAKEPNAVSPEERSQLLPQDVQLSAQPRSESPVHEAGDAPQVEQPAEEKEEEKLDLKGGEAQKDQQPAVGKEEKKLALKDQQPEPQGDQVGEGGGQTAGALDPEGDGGAEMPGDSVSVQIEGAEQQAGKPGKPDLPEA